MNNILKKKIKDFRRTITPFYRKWPYKGGVSLHRVDSRVCYSEEYSFFYNRIPKVANSTITHTLHSMINGWGEYHKSVKDSFMRPSEMTKEQVSQLNTTFKFAFSRNPFTRTLSAYLDKIVRVGYLSARGKYKHKVFSKTEERPSFLDFCHYLENEGLYTDPHWAPQSSLLVIPVDELDYIGKFESLHSDLNYVTRVIFKDAVTGDIDFSGPPKTDSGNKLATYYGEKEASIISRLYAMDFDVFDYEPSIILSDKKNFIS